MTTIPLLRALLLATITFFTIDVCAKQLADRIFLGGPVLTINDKAPRAEAVAIAGGLILAVGDRESVMAYQGKDTEIVDLEGHAMLPGFVDSHGHAVMGGLQALSANLLAPPDGAVKDIASIQATLRAWMTTNKQTVDKVQLIVGFGYDQSQLKELRHPTREDLDAVSTTIPVIIVHQSGHFGAANSKALELAGVDADSAAAFFQMWQTSLGGGSMEGSFMYSMASAITMMFVYVTQD